MIMEKLTGGGGGGVKIHDKETMNIKRKIKGGHPHQFRSIWEDGYLLEQHNDLTLGYESSSVVVNMNFILKPHYFFVNFQSKRFCN